ncbi:hypothetical protein MYX75_12810, partial [Acidobacteria bacterium AH-259-A15]|nr:hypothetical protein [Acidobacteria bacterium AH-259-A15]
HRLKQDLQGKLDLPRRGCGFSDRTGSWITNFRPWHAAPNIHVGLSEVGTVEKVEKLSPELKLRLFAQGEALGHSKIESDHSRRS